MVDRIRRLCKTQKMTLASLEKELGFANGSLAKTDEKTQSGRILAIARFFGVSMEYIMTGQIGDTLTAPEKELIDMFRKLNDDGRLRAYDYMEYLIAGTKNISGDAATSSSSESA